ncbi:MAG: carbamoyl-phosphate synthase large subunit [Defluviitaleaceae bacterium]|nr:carbamoyl-phosphate synthase large subunit [Defluviitaleaceae bacterium]
MPKREDLKKILIIGSGPIVIGQACEFDYSGTQACQALKSLGYEIVLVNSNPATIMTDPDIADITYIEPLNKNRIEKIIAHERPDALLPNCGGQTALNLAFELEKSGILAKYNVEVIGINLAAIERGEDRIIFKQMMDELGIEMAKSAETYTVEGAVEIAKTVGYPCVVRPAYTMGGAGGGICYTEEELRVVAARGIDRSLINQVLIEESILGWEELELEIVRDYSGHMITACYIENLDPMGVHTGDSICVAPMLDVKPEVQKRLQEAAYKIVAGVGVVGGCNCQFAYNAKEDRIIIIEINPRTSRSSALASKATGFPIARVAALLAAGFNLNELPYWKEGTLDKYTPPGDYVVVKFPRFAFEKFSEATDILGTQMKAVGESMSIGKSFKESLQKSIRSLENGRHGLGFASNFNDLTKEELMEKLERPTSERLYMVYEALRKGVTVEEMHNHTSIKPFFLNHLKEMVDMEEEIITHRGNPLPDTLLIRAKKEGFGDKYIAKLLQAEETAIASQRAKLGIYKSFDSIQVSGVDDDSAFYYYSTYLGKTQQTLMPSKQKIMILGGGPNRIGQGIEFDYCCVHATYALRALGYKTIMINCNPETVSTDYDTADSLYFEPLTVEDVMAIYRHEQPSGVVVQFGGQTPLNIAEELKALGVPILGTQPDIIATAEDRDLFRAMMERLNIPMPESGMAKTVAEALNVAKGIGYPVIVRPSYVLGGRGMEVVYDAERLGAYMEKAISESGPDMEPILIDRFLDGALECEADAISDGENVLVPAIIEHIESTGVHSGDSACSIPPITIREVHQLIIRDYTKKIAQELKVVGLMNIQYAIDTDTGKVYVLEANPRASRTVPLVSKVCDIQMAKLATEVMIKAREGQDTAALLNQKPRKLNVYGVKEAIFPFNMFHEVDPVLGPEMRSTGEVLGLSDNFHRAFFLSQEGGKHRLPDTGTVLFSISKDYYSELPDIANAFLALGFKLMATQSTYQAAVELGIECQPVAPLIEGGKPIADLIMDDTVNIVVNTRRRDTDNMGPNIRRAAVRKSTPMYTTLEAARTAIDAIAAWREEPAEVRSLQDYHK